MPTLDVAETDTAFEVCIALPGLNKYDVEIEYENDILTVSGERRWEHEEKDNGRRYHRLEAGSVDLYPCLIILTQIESALRLKR